MLCRQDKREESSGKNKLLSLSLSHSLAMTNSITVVFTNITTTHFSLDALYSLEESSVPRKTRPKVTKAKITVSSILTNYLCLSAQYIQVLPNSSNNILIDCFLPNDRVLTCDFSAKPAEKMILPTSNVPVNKSKFKPVHQSLAFGIRKITQLVWPFHRLSSH